MSHPQSGPDPYGPADPYGPDGYRPPADRYGSGGAPTGRRGGGVPDAAIVGSLALAISVTLLVWSSTGLGGLLRAGSWPEGVTFTSTAGALRSLLTAPADITAAWPQADATALPPGGVFWLIFAAQLVVVGGTVLWCAVRIGTRRARRAEGPGPGRRPGGARKAPNAPDRGYPYAEHGPSEGNAGSPVGGVVPTGAGAGTATSDASDAVLTAGPAAVVTDPDGRLYRDTAARRSDHGPVHLYDPEQLTDTPVRLRWAPHHGCADHVVARARATALLAPVRPSAPVFQLDAETAETVLRCYLHAAALTGEPFTTVHRWAQSNSSDPAGTLRSHPRVAPGASMELEAALTSHPERRDAALALINRALHGLEDPAVRRACAPGKADAAALAELLETGGTLYVVGRGPATLSLRTALLRAVTPPLTHVPAGPAAVGGR
ncbi:hypothetical protein [Streptomyces spiramenti]|uniref:Integral membrane protein n=1 Tax=Streptomyces spiramenti TaxID=2720606 RepID=A0ABX1ARY2_9ACTN|nr:hypothetical protein [Streptomyces spiramenti]NJP67172.1 hypothetical protein [Streptomyces spiramenti]